MHVNNNKQWDFVQTIIYFIQHKHLVVGDILVLNNTAVHVGLDTVELITDLCMQQA